jgi:formate dehydrogenase major subunit
MLISLTKVKLIAAAEAVRRNSQGWWPFRQRWSRKCVSYLCAHTSFASICASIRNNGRSGGTMFRFSLTRKPQTSREPFSVETLDKSSRLRGATVTEGICPYCAVGCGQLIYSKGGELINIEGNPDSPISGGHLCPKGANAFQLAVNSHRVRNVLYRAPYSDHWETRTMDWALDQIAQRVKKTRDADFTTRDEQGRLLNSVRSIGTLGGATIDNEENYLIKKLFGGGLGVVSIENQARI